MARGRDATKQGQIIPKLNTSDITTATAIIVPIIARCNVGVHMSHVASSPFMTATIACESDNVSIAVRGGVDMGVDGAAAYAITGGGVLSSMHMNLINRYSSVTASVVRACFKMSIAVDYGVSMGSDIAAAYSITGVGIVTSLHMIAINDNCTITASVVRACTNSSIAFHGRNISFAMDCAAGSINKGACRRMTLRNNGSTITASALRACGSLSIVVDGAAAGATTGDDCAAASPVTVVTVGPLLHVCQIDNGSTIMASAVVACGDLEIAVNGGVDTGDANAAVSSITAIGVTTSTNMELIHKGSSITAFAVCACGKLDIAVHGGVDTGSAKAAVSSVTGVAVTNCMHMYLIIDRSTITASAVGAGGNLDAAVHGGVDTSADSSAVSSTTAVGVTTCMHM